MNNWVIDISFNMIKERKTHYPVIDKWVKPPVQL